MMKTLKNLHMFFLPIFLIFTGCVGTVQQAQPPESLKMTNPPTTFSFPGIITARAISHNRVELEFFPAASEAVTYQLTVNDSDIPMPIDPQSLIKVNGGRVLYTVENLHPDQEYKFKITAKNNSTAAISQNENEAYARTFDNIVADFKGISKVSLLPGNTDGAIRVDWIAPNIGGFLESGPYDPVHYEITLISSVGGAGNLNNNTYIGTDRRTILVPTPPLRAGPSSNPSYTNVDGLAPNTLYYVQVRAIHSLYQNADEDPDITSIPFSREINSRFLTIKTDPGGALFDFRRDNVILANAPGRDGLNKIDIFWQPGSGDFTGYRIFVRKYDGLGDPTIDDKLSDTVMQSMHAQAIHADPGDTTYRQTNLESMAWYQVKVALCKVSNCPVSATDPNAAIISEMKAIMVQPTLAAFNGINSIQPPISITEIDTLKLQFDPPLVGSGWANTLEFYCVDPQDHTQMVKFEDNDPLVTAIGNCNGLSLEGITPPLNNFSSQKVKGVIADGTTEYCFAASPVINEISPEIRLAPAGRIVRCAYPQVTPPTVSQFPGLKNSCVVSGVTGTVNWTVPTGGVYSGYKVYWKEKKNNEKFSFPEAIAGSAGYFSTPVELPPSTVTYDATDLMPGKTYQIGILATVDMPNPQQDLYSEYNLSVFDCIVPLPIATFKGFTRIFAVGPKTDGRVPNSTTTRAPPTNSWLYEAVDSVGQPYEVGRVSETVPHTSLNYVAPPGRDYGTDLSQPFDGTFDTSGFAASRTGIVSLAWEDVELFTEAYQIFTHTDNQPPAPSIRTGRKFGYKVFRSNDNKLTWKELTTGSGLIYSSDYTYRHRANSSTVTKRMAFFTDYSVKALEEYHDASTAKDIDRARIYHYKIVPVFDGKSLEYATPNHNIVKVTLPPPNMALVHRWMANRGRCLELDKGPNISANYSCPYNGVGATPTTVPHMVGFTALDQGGDLLVDRYELGCRFTRGDPIQASESGASYFDSAVDRHVDDDNIWPAFKGYRSIGTVEDNTTPFKGCGGIDSQSMGSTRTGADYPGGPMFVPEYSKYLQGDCIGNHRATYYASPCTAGDMLLGYPAIRSVNTPGVFSNDPPIEDCSIDSPSNPTTITTKLMGFHAPNQVMQSEFLAVFHNTAVPSHLGLDHALPFEGPSTASLTATANLTTWTVGSGANCSVNLAAIDGSGYMKPRWLTVDHMHPGRTRFKGSNAAPLFNKTVNELMEVNATTSEPLTFYNGLPGGSSAFNLPSSDLVKLNSNPRFRGTTRLSRIFSSNASKLPPLGKLSSEQALLICNDYFVQVGFASENGTFAPDQPVKQKRPLRRPETVTAAAWNETYDTTTVANIENSTSSGSCNNFTKNNHGSSISKGGFLNNDVAVSGLARSPMMTGSSDFVGLGHETDTFNTDKCISKFGIQDIIGNVSEHNSERIFCDYSDDAAYMGEVNGNWDGGNLAINASTGNGIDINIWNTNHEREEWAVLRADADGNSFELAFDNPPAPSRFDLRPWVKIGINSGYCSPVDDDPTNRLDGSDFRNLSSGIWAPLYNPGNVLNTIIAERTQPDQESVLGWRNGDGRFMDFGPQGLGSALNNANTLALTDSSTNKYFNPIIGLPLACNNDSCRDPAIPETDNTLVSIAEFNSTLLPHRLPLVDPEPEILEFPIGNSDISHLGISDFTYSATQFTTLPVTPAADRMSILTKVTVDDTSMTNPRWTSKIYPDDYVTGDNLDVYRVIWNVPRGSEFAFTSGGHSNSVSAGRFTASLQIAAIFSAPDRSGTGSITSGARCAIMINQE